MYKRQIIPVGYGMPSEKSAKPKKRPDIDKVLRFNSYSGKYMRPRKEVEAF